VSGQVASVENMAAAHNFSEWVMNTFFVYWPRVGTIVLLILASVAAVVLSDDRSAALLAPLLNAVLISVPWLVLSPFVLGPSGALARSRPMKPSIGAHVPAGLALFGTGLILLSYFHPTASTAAVGMFAVLVAIEMALVLREHKIAPRAA
jgi:hypothetical protein